MASSCNLPEEVLMEILLRLPVESVTRFQCVCKSWYTLFNNPKFITKHLNQSSDSMILVKRQSPTTGTNILSFLSNETLDVDVNLDIPFYKESRHLRLVGHCNGILCLSDYGDDVILCNPCIREFKTLPKSCIPRPSDVQLDISTEGVGFGYDPKTNDYKVVRIFSFWHEVTYNTRHPSRVEVYNLSTDSWREIKTVVGASIFYYPCFEMYFNGAYYWWAMFDDGIDDGILSFDMSNEVFRKMPEPDFVHRDGHCRSLALLNDSIVLIHYPVRGVEKSFDIWGMNESNAKEPWTKLMTIGPLSGVQEPLVFWKNIHFLIEADDGQVISYNLSNQQIETLPIHGVPETLAAVIYTKTLVSIQGSMN